MNREDWDGEDAEIGWEGGMYRWGKSELGGGR